MRSRRAVSLSIGVSALVLMGAAFHYRDAFRPKAMLWLRIHSLRAEPGPSPRVAIEAWVPADASMALAATRDYMWSQEHRAAVCGNFSAASLTFEDGPRGGRFRTGMSMEGMQRFFEERMFAARWEHEKDGSIHVITTDPLSLVSDGPIPTKVADQDLWVEVEVPKRGQLKAVALGVRESSGAYRPITF